MAGYLGAIPVPQATQHRESFTATSGQTTFNTAGYTVGFLDVYLNGSHLSPADVTATNGSDVVLGACLVNDIVDVISYTAFEINAQTFTGTTTMDVAAITGVLTTTAATVFNGGFAANAASTITTADNSSGLILESTDADAQVGPTLQLKRNSGSPADADNLGNIIFVGENDADEAVLYGNIGFTAPDVSNGTEDGLFFLNVVNAGTERSRMFMNATETVFNEESLDLDFRVESNGNTHMLFVDGGNNTVGIGTSSPTALMHINGGSTAADGIHYIANNTSSGPAGIVMNSGHGNWKIMNSQTVANALEFIDGGSPDVTKMMIDSGGNVLFNTTAVPSASSGGAAFDPNSNGRAVLKLATTNTGNQGLAEFFNPNGQVGGIVTNGSATAYNTSSDYRLKENVDYDWDATTRLKQLKPARFNFIADADTTVDGFLAHEAQAVVPECVTGTKDAMRDEEYEVTPAVLDENGTETTAAVTGTRSVPDMQGIDQSKIVPLLVKTILELEARITVLENA